MRRFQGRTMSQNVTNQTERHIKKCYENNVSANYSGNGKAPKLRYFQEVIRNYLSHNVTLIISDSVPSSKTAIIAPTLHFYFMLIIFTVEQAKSHIHTIALM